MTGSEIAILKEAQEGFYKAFFKESFKQLFKISNYLSSSPSFEKKSPSLEQIKDFICYNQGAYAQYNFLVSRKHRSLKELLKSTSPDLKEVSACKDSLEAYLNHEIENVYVENFKRIKVCFGERSKHKSRICVKVENPQGDVVDLFRDTRIYYGKSYQRQSNTGFQYAYDTGKAYICNNIPAYAKGHRYVNPRLNPHRVANYELSYRERRRINKGQEDDEKWIACWESSVRKDGTQIYPDTESSYKSTVIIPMTLIGNTLQQEFREHFEISSEAEHRGIWGYLCFDNHSLEYFNENADILMGWVFADILSLYLITRLTYTKYSETYNEAISFVKVKSNSV